LSPGLQIAFAAALWGTWSLFFRPAERISPIAPALEAFVVFAVMLMVTTPWALRARARCTERRPPRAWLAVAVLGLFDAMNALLFFSAMQHTSLSIAVLTHYLAPVLVAVGAPVVLGDRLRPATLAALAAALGGLALLLEPWRPAEAVWTGAAYGAASAVFFAANILIAKRVQHHFAPIELLSWHLPTALLLLAPFALVGGAGPAAVAPASLALLAAGGLLPGALAGVVFLRGLVRTDATRAAVLMLLEPVSAMLIGATVWNETPTLPGAIGATLILAAAWTVARVPLAAATT
jgi:drug/metabolite transporter, DME family